VIDHSFVQINHSWKFDDWGRPVGKDQSDIRFQPCIRVDPSTGAVRALPEMT
jgi:hypothetical protein